MTSSKKILPERTLEGFKSFIGIGKKPHVPETKKISIQRKIGLYNNHLKTKHYIIWTQIQVNTVFVYTYEIKENWNTEAQKQLSLF